MKMQTEFIWATMQYEKPIKGDPFLQNSANEAKERKKEKKNR